MAYETHRLTWLVRAQGSCSSGRHGVCGWVKGVCELQIDCTLVEADSWEDQIVGLDKRIGGRTGGCTLQNVEESHSRISNLEMYLHNTR